MDRTERTGLGLSVAGHVALAVILSLGLFAASKPIIPKTQPIDIQIVDKVGLTDTVPNPSPTPPAARVTPEVGIPEEAAPEPTPQPTPAPVRAPEPAPREAVAPPKPVAKPSPVKPPPPKPVAKPSPVKPSPAKPVAKPAAAKASPAKPSATKAPAAEATPRRRPGLSRSLIAGLTDTPGAASAKPSTATGKTSNAPLGALAQASIGRALRNQIKPFWKAPTGADADQLRTELRMTLARDGSIVSVSVIGTTGQTDSNRSQVRLHQEAAVKAVKLAAPFSLPTELYDAWKQIDSIGFDRRLSQ